MAKTREISICSNCGSTDFLPDYPAPGIGICSECGKGIISIKIMETPNDATSEKCPSCNSDEFDWIRREEGEDFLAFKCSKCSKVGGYKKEQFEENDFWLGIDSDDDENWSSIDIKIAQKEGKPILSAARHRELRRELFKKQKNPVEKCKRQLTDLFEKNRWQLMKEGIAHYTITRALGTAQSYITEEGAVTENQVIILFATSIPFVERIRFRRREIKECNATERIIADIFKVDRKTIRKWKKILEEFRPRPVWSSFTYFRDGSSAYAEADLPDEVESATKLVKPYLLKDDYGEMLSWRVTYTDGSWTDLSDGSYECFKGLYWESGGKLDLP
jgi:hypothetical protein